ncbi:hypothetical protein [Pontibacter pudoricolor]|uniref:hypothetical protein n=1 Tax=Pontibacter pudoricolor TaxID=2694930 RepID=UPI0013920901|nr:hypothetical protein [Pontibacter pudoricolor]
METPIVDRIETKRAEKMSKLFLYIGIALISILLLKLYFGQNEFGSRRFWLNLLPMLLPTYLMIVGYKGLKKRTGQFIEWQKSKILYRLGENSLKQHILLDSITEVNIQLENIQVMTTEGEHNLNISDFTDYETIKRIKSNFEKMKLTITL